MKKLALFALLAIIVSSCTVRLTDFTIISTKNVDLSNMGKYKRGAERVEGKSGGIFLFIFPIQGLPDLKESIDRAIEKTKGCVALADGVLYARNWHIVLVGESSYIVEGTPIIDPSIAGDNFPTRHICEFNADGTIKSLKAMSEEEFEVEKAKLLGN